ncbi:hypothetical protein CDL12_17761 [Handroanthus impetiginosus]|uniref:Uncharacterized protein n=1 Tax=Handroanthus impetiginosus TaxID=429701 RepID=A0A2G9GWP3_9LAMI|nr:hypothetical protein CDL12_17761 [Handroanthus impetiginosus]
MTSSPTPPAVAPSSESQLSSLIYDLSQNVQVAMDNMLKMINCSLLYSKFTDFHMNFTKSKDSVLQRKNQLEEEKDHFQKAAFAVLDMLNSGDIS